MARGKYAARAANREAAEAQQSAAHLSNLLATERIEHTRKIAELNGRIAQLQGRLDREVAALAEAEVRKVGDEYRAQLAAERAERHERSLEVGRLLFAQGVKLSDLHAWARLAELLGLSIGELTEGAGADTNRHSRRTSTNRAHHIATLSEQGRMS